MVIELGEGQYPPENETCYIVLRDPTGRFYVSDSSMGFRRSKWAAHYPISEEERASTIDRAKRYANQHGVQTVYVMS